MREGIPIHQLNFFLSTQRGAVKRVAQQYREAYWSFDGPQHMGILCCREVNGIVEHLHIYPQDHSLRGCCYAEPDKDSEGYVLPFQRTYICSDPPYFLLGDEDTRGHLKERPWASEMTKAGLPAAFIERIRPLVTKAMDNYRRGRHLTD
jgi:hypothetical protein